MPDGSVRAGYWDRSNSPMALLTSQSGATYSSAKTANYAGQLAGDSNSSSTGVFPAFWQNIGSSNPQRPFNGWDGGTTWDINTDGYMVGELHTNLGQQLAFRYLDSSTELIINLPTGGFGQTEARSINANKTIGGHVGGFPAVWALNTSNVYVLTQIASSSDWAPFSGRGGYIIGVTEGGISVDGPFAVGWMTPGADPEGSPGQPFIYSMGSGKIRFMGIRYGEPLQISGRNVQANDGTVEFIGNTPMPYVWVGSANPGTEDQYKYGGCVDDIAAFFDPDAPLLSNFETAQVTGVNSSLEFGGLNFGEKVFVTQATSNWYDPIAPECILSITPLLGQLVGKGVGVCPLAPDGQIIRFEKYLVPTLTSPKVRLEVKWCVPDGFTANSLSFRVTSRMVTGGQFDQKLTLYDYSGSGYGTGANRTDVSSLQMSTRFLTVNGSSEVAKYVGPLVDFGIREMKAKLEYYQTGLGGSGAPTVDIEQAKPLAK